jgi:8-oxo-dGTP diphosphatase
MEPKIVTAAILKKGQAVLLMRRAPDENLAGKWEFPGGKLEVGETPEICLKRELQEELDIEVKVGRHLCDSLYNYPAGSILLKAYFVDWLSGDILLRVHDKMQWVDSKDLLSFELAPADVEIAHKIQEVISYV